MGYPLRQSTAVAVMVGPLIDDTDFKTREASVAYNQAGVDCALQKGATGTWDAVTITDTGGDNDWTNKGDGHYTLELTAAQTDTLGPLKLAYYATGILPYSDQFVVIPAAVYDALYAGTGNLTAVLTADYDAAKTAASATNLAALKAVADNILRWFTNKRIVTATSQKLRDDGDTADLYTQALSDDGTTATRGSAS